MAAIGTERQRADRTISRHPLSGRGHSDLQTPTFRTSAPISRRAHRLPDTHFPAERRTEVLTGQMSLILLSITDSGYILFVSSS